MSETTTSSEADREDDGWEDAEDDHEDIQAVSLFDDKVFPDVKSMLTYCKTTYEFDFIALLKRLSALPLRMTYH